MATRTQLTALTSNDAGSTDTYTKHVTGTDVGNKRALDVNLAAGSVTVAATVNTNGSVSNQAVTGAAATFLPPANAVGFVLEAESANTDNIRWCIGATASSSVGMLGEPGRDSGYIPCAAAISVFAISGTQNVSVQWVLSS